MRGRGNGGAGVARCRGRYLKVAHINLKHEVIVAAFLSSAEKVNYRVDHFKVDLKIRDMSKYASIVVGTELKR